MKLLSPPLKPCQWINCSEQERKRNMCEEPEGEDVELAPERSAKEEITLREVMPGAVDYQQDISMETVPFSAFESHLDQAPPNNEPHQSTPTPAYVAERLAAPSVLLPPPQPQNQPNGDVTTIEPVQDFELDPDFDYGDDEESLTVGRALLGIEAIPNPSLP